MRIFTSAYVLLALASWSALAAPLPGYRRDNEDVAAEGKSLSSSTLTGRQGVNPIFKNLHSLSSEPLYNITGIDKLPQAEGNSTNTTTSTNSSDCGNSKSNTDDQNNQATTSGSDPTPTTTSSGPPAIARRRFRNPMTRRNEDSPSVWEDSHASSTKDKRITVGDVLEYYLRRRAASWKRSMSPRTSRGAI